MYDQFFSGGYKRKRKTAEDEARERHERIAQLNADNALLRDTVSQSQMFLRHLLPQVLLLVRANPKTAHLTLKHAGDSMPCGPDVDVAA